MHNFFAKYVETAYATGSIFYTDGRKDSRHPISMPEYVDIRECQNFVIDGTLFKKSSPTSAELRQLMESDFEELGELFLPFKNCFFSRGDDHEMVYMHDRSQPEPLLVYGIHIVERGFRTYDINVFGAFPSSGPLIFKPNEHTIKIIQKLIDLFLQVVNRFPIATVESDKIKYKIKGQGIRFLKPNSTIYISTKEKREAKYQYEGKKTTWFRRFAKRGHWRRFFIEGTEEIDYSKTGKDREGNYVVKGMTWVVDHIVGPDDAPLMKQTRVVKNPVFLDDGDWDDDLDEETSNPVFDKWDSASIAALEGQYFNKLPDQYPYEAYVYLSRELSPYPDKKRGIIKKVDIVKRSGKVLYYQSGSHIVRIRPWNVALTREELITRFGLE